MPAEHTDNGGDADPGTQDPATLDPSSLIDTSGLIDANLNLDPTMLLDPTRWIASQAKPSGDTPARCGSNGLGYAGSDRSARDEISRSRLGGGGRDAADLARDPIDPESGNPRRDPDGADGLMSPRSETSDILEGRKRLILYLTISLLDYLST